MKTIKLTKQYGAVWRALRKLFPEYSESYRIEILSDLARSNSNSHCEEDFKVLINSIRKYKEYRIWVHVKADDKDSLEYYKSLGFKRMGIIRDELFRDKDDKGVIQMLLK